jgi:hypothetical protein
MKYWYYWNIKAEKKAIFSYKIEEFDKNLNNLLKLGNFAAVDNLSHVNTKTNTREHTNLSWEDLLKEDEVLTKSIMALATSYGYEI